MLQTGDKANSPLPPDPRPVRLEVDVLLSMRTRQLAAAERARLVMSARRE